jgi:SNF2 family DNA or RNA helicase
MFISRDARSLVVPATPSLASLVPHARALAHGGIDYLVIPNERDEAKLLRNLGLAVPAPILSRYDWAGGTPWEIQRTTAALLSESMRAYVLSTMGTGKTRSVLWALDYLMKFSKLGKILITAPLSTLTPVWETELFRVLPKLRVKVLYGSRSKRLQLLAEDADVYVINHHGIGLLQNDLVAKGFDAVVIDEMAVFRNKSTDLWKAANAVINPEKGRAPRFAWGLTGSPTPTAPTDAWAQIKMLTPTRVARTISQFQDQTMRRASQFKWYARPDANETVHTAMQPSVRFTMDDVMELPPTSFVDRQVTLGTDATKAYKLLYTKMRMMTNNGETITAVNEGVLQGKLLQVAAGFIYTDKKTVYVLDSQARLDALDEVIAETDRKVIVFAPFLHALSGIAGHLRKSGHNVAVVNGGTSRTIRDKTFQQFQDPTSPLKLIVAHPQCMAHGLTLTEANVIIWYSPTTSLEIYEQANARIVRPGQTSKTLIVHLSGTAVERAVYARLQGKGKLQGLLLEMFRSQTLDF